MNSQSLDFVFDMLSFQYLQIKNTNNHKYLLAVGRFVVGCWLWVGVVVAISRGSRRAAAGRTGGAGCSTGRRLGAVLRVEQARPPPGSRQARGLHVQRPQAPQATQLQAQGRRARPAAPGTRAARHLPLAVLLAVAARLAGALLAAAPIVGLDVLGEVIGPHEALVAHGAGEPFLPRVRPQVPLQFVRPGEPLAAKQPIAHERALACVPPQMRLQVRRFPIHLTASWYVTTVYIFLAQVDTRWAQALRLLAIGAVARGAPRVATLRAGRRRGRQGRGRRGGGRVQPEALRRQHGLVRVLQEVLAGGE